MSLENPAKDERLLEAMKIAVTKAKQLAARAFQEDLIDRLPSVVEKEPLYVGVTLIFSQELCFLVCIFMRKIIAES